MPAIRMNPPIRSVRHPMAKQPMPWCGSSTCCGGTGAGGGGGAKGGGWPFMQCEDYCVDVGDSSIRFEERAAIARCLRICNGVTCDNNPSPFIFLDRDQ